MKIFDLFQRGYRIGNEHGANGARRRPQWELALMNPITWCPGVDQESFINGYIQGYHDGIALHFTIAKIVRLPP